MKFKIYYGHYVNPPDEDEPNEILDFPNRNKAINYAWQQACEDYDNYAGLHGLRSIEDIMEEEDVDEDEAEDIYNDERENALEYNAVSVADDEVEKWQKM